MSSNLLHLILIGATASGKGTLSKYIMQEFDNFMHISLGDILRLHVKLKTRLGKEVQTYIDSGKLVPDHLVADTIFQELNKARTNNWILDGFPRTLNQAKLLHGVESDTSKSCGFKKNNVTVVFNLIVPDNVIIKRTSNRWVHLPSGRIYNKGFHEPRVKWKDDISGEDLVQRHDDKPEVIAERLKIHRTQTEPIIDFYRQHCVDVVDLQSEKIERVWSTVNKYLKDKSAV